MPSSLQPRSPAVLALAAVAPGSRPALRGALDRLAQLAEPGSTARTFAWARVDYQTAVALREGLRARGYAASTINLHLSALRTCVREGVRAGLIPRERLAELRDVDGIRADVLPAGRALVRGELRALVDAAERNAASRRDVALVAVLYGCGLRRAELCDLEIGDYDGAALAVRHGKRNKARQVPCPPGTVRALDAWIGERGAKPGPLFVRVRRGGHLSDEGLTGEAVRLCLARLATAAKLSRTTPHDLRRSCITDLLDHGADVLTVAGYVGHASSDTTRRYDRRPLEARQRAAQLLDVP